MAIILLIFGSLKSKCESKWAYQVGPLTPARVPLGDQTQLTKKL
jgi:hypothetical protein